MEVTTICLVSVIKYILFSLVNMIFLVKDWLKQNQESLIQNDLKGTYMRATMSTPEVCFCLKYVLTDVTSTFWRAKILELHSKGIEVALNDGRFRNAVPEGLERWGWEEIVVQQ